MHIRQIVLVVLCCLINMADGYDVASLGLAAPVLTKDWGVSPQRLGIAFSATSMGLMLGAMFVAPLADRLGRRAVMLAALVDITIVHWASAVSSSIWVIAILRFCMGLGLGTLLVNLNVMVAEFANDRWRNLLLAILHTGFSLGTAASGAVAVFLLEPFGWRSLFIAGGIMNLAVLMIAIICLLESPEYLTTRQPRDALARVNRLLGLLKHAPLQALPPMQNEGRPKISVAALLAPQMRQATVLLWIASFTFAIVGYFLLNWKPQILVNSGMTPTQASYVGIVNGAFGVLGHLSIAFLSKRIEETRLTAIYFAMIVVTLVIFGTVPASPVLLLATAGVLNLFTVGTYTGLFLVAIKFYSTEMRNGGVGFMVGWSRAGAIVGPMLGGLLIGAQFSREMTFAVFAVIAVIPVVAMFQAARQRAAQSVAKREVSA